MKITREFVENNLNTKFNIHFKKPTNVVISGRYQEVSKMNKVRFWISNRDNSICYSTARQKTKGYNIQYLNTENIQYLEEIVKLDKATIVKKNAKSLYKRTHKNGWTNLQKEWKNISEGGEVTQDFKWHYSSEKLNFRNINSIFKKYEPRNYNILVEQITKAFEEKKEFTWSHNSLSSYAGRDLKISTKLCDDGIFRAWFSSEYPGCCNGDYYLLISPTTAIYYERD